MTTMQQMLLGKSTAVGVPQLNATHSFLSLGLLTKYMFNTDGSLVSTEDGADYTWPTQWLSVHPDSTTAALYEIRREQVSGTLGVSFTGTMTDMVWYPLTSQRGLTVTPGLSARSNESIWDIRLVGGDGTILASTYVTATAEP